MTDITASVCMCTYDRPELLAEAVESFLRQTRTDTELVIVNDRDGQEIIVDHPRVRVINVPDRFPFLGTKRKFTAEQARGKYLLFWDDDDIFLPHHIQDCFDRLQYFRNNNISRAELEWEDNGLHQLQLRRCRYVHTMMIDKDVYWKAGGHVDQTRNEDIAFVHKLLKGKFLSHFQMPFFKPGFIYRPLTGRCRISTLKTIEPQQELRWRMMEDEANQRNITGRIVVEPKWNRDYALQANQSLGKLK